MSPDADWRKAWGGNARACLTGNAATTRAQTADDVFQSNSHTTASIKPPQQAATTAGTVCLSDMSSQDESKPQARQATAGFPYWHMTGRLMSMAAGRWSPPRYAARISAAAMACSCKCNRAPQKQVANWQRLATKSYEVVQYTTKQQLGCASHTPRVPPGVRNRTPNAQAFRRSSSASRSASSSASLPFMSSARFAAAAASAAYFRGVVMDSGGWWW